MIKLFELNGASVKCSFFCAAVMIAAAVLGETDGLLLLFLSLSLHEMSHTLVAAALGYAICSIEIQPFGFVARLASRPSSLRDELVIASAGPLCSAVIGMSAFALIGSYGGNGAALTEFGKLNMLLCAVNLIPALPLDGGRIAYSLLARKLPERTALYSCATLSFIASAALIVVFVYGMIEYGEANLTMPVMALLLTLAAFREIKNGYVEKPRIVLSRTHTLQRGQSIPHRTLVVHEQTAVGRAALEIKGGTFTEFIVVDDAMNEIGRLAESEIAYRCRESGDKPLSALIDRAHRR